MVFVPPDEVMIGLSLKTDKEWIINGVNYGGSKFDITRIA